MNDITQSIRARLVAVAVERRYGGSSNRLAFLHHTNERRLAEARRVLRVAVQRMTLTLTQIGAIVFGVSAVSLIAGFVLGAIFSTFDE